MFTGSLAAGVLGAGASIFGSSKQADAAKNSAALQKQMFDKTLERTQPFVDFGNAALGEIAGRNAYFNNPLIMDQAALEKTPGYQFTRDQGLKSLQNGFAARGLGSSGAAMKGAAEYTTGLTNKTYLDQYNVERTNRNDIFNRLLGRATLGANAASGLGTQSNQAASNIGNQLVGAGNAYAAGGIGATNSITNGLMGAAAYQRQYGTPSWISNGLYGSGDTNTRIDY